MIGLWLWLGLRVRVRVKVMVRVRFGFMVMVMVRVGVRIRVNLTLTKTLELNLNLLSYWDCCQNMVRKKNCPRRKVALQRDQNKYWNDKAETLENAANNNDYAIMFREFRTLATSTTVKNNINIVVSLILTI